MLQANAPIKQSPPAIPASVGEVVSIRQAKNAITAPVIPPHNPDFHKRRTPHCA